LAGALFLGSKTVSKGKLKTNPDHPFGFIIGFALPKSAVLNNAF
jgi:hypothetical protein